MTGLLLREPIDWPAVLRGLFADLRPWHVLTVAALLALAAALTRFVNHLVARSIERQRERGTLQPEAVTRLQVCRRLINIAIWLVAVAIGLTQFPELRVLSTGLLASAGLSGLIVGLAARSTLGNAVAGITIAFAQPVRIGDDVELRGERGTVEDISLLFTVVRLVDGKRLIIPNDTLSTEVLKNLTLGGVTRIARAEVLVPLSGDPVAVRDALLAVAKAHEGLDRSAAPPEVQWVRIDERGVLLRLVAACGSAPAADRFVQSAMRAAAQLVFRNV